MADIPVFPNSDQDKTAKEILDKFNSIQLRDEYPKFVPYTDKDGNKVSPLTDFIYYKKMPEVYRQFDKPLGRPLYRYLQSLIEGGYAELVTNSAKNGIEDLMELIDPQTCPDKFLPYYFQSMGIDWFQDLITEDSVGPFITQDSEHYTTADLIEYWVTRNGRGVYYLRTFLSNLGEVFKRRGTESAVKFIAKTLTEMDVDLRYQRIIEDGVTKSRVLWVELKAETVAQILDVELNSKVIKRFVDTQIPYYITSIVSYILSNSTETRFYSGVVPTKRRVCHIETKEWDETK